MAILSDPPEWRVPGTKPPRNIIEELGWEVASYPPAPWFNWFFNRVFESLLELEAATLARVINEAGVPGIMAGRESERPAASPETVGRIFIATDTKRMYRDRGTGWDLLNTPEAIGAETPAGAQEKVNAHAAKTDGVHGAPAGKRLLHTGDMGAANGVAALDANSHVVQDVAYTSAVSGFTPASVRAALDALAGVRIVEMGTNANGTYVCWENGLQVCWKLLFGPDFPPADETRTVQGLTYRFRNYRWTFPKSFASIPVVLASGDLGGSAPEFHGVTNVTTTAVTVEAGTLSSGWGLVNEDVLAIGHWK